MAEVFRKRDYRLSGPENNLAKQKGIVEAEWYKSPVPRERMKQLMKRKDGPAIRDTIILFAALIGTGILGYQAWGTWWAVPAFAIYGAIWATAGDSRWHECGHGTAFKTHWMNEVVYYIAAFMIFRPATAWRWSHTRHHTDTIVVGRDPEIFTTRPPVWRAVLGEAIRIYSVPKDLMRAIRHFFGALNKDERDYIPEEVRPSVFREARINLLIYLAFVVWSISIHSILPLMFVGLPAFYGNFINLLNGLTQHVGLNEDVLDHRLNTRTVYMNPVSRFLYWNMNYHVEHHMFPMVPYHALPKLHEEIKADCPAARSGLWEALKEVVHALAEQRKNPNYSVIKPLPSTATPYNFGPAPLVRAENEQRRSS